MATTRYPLITSLTPEQTALQHVYRDKWIAIALSTGRMTPAERLDVDRCVRALYHHAKLPQPKAVVVVPSPLAMALAGGAAAWWWHQHRSAGVRTLSSFAGAPTDAATDPATRVATAEAMFLATDDATDAAVRAATLIAADPATRIATDAAMFLATDAAMFRPADDVTIDATFLATDAATRGATEEATLRAMEAAVRAATVDAPDDATFLATNAATVDAPDDATFLATRTAARAATAAATFLATDDAPRAAVAACAQAWRTCYNGGSTWAGWCSYLDFWPAIIGERPDCAKAFTKFVDYRRLAEISGFRWMSPDFCLVSEKPVKLTTEINGQGVHVAHCEDGPSHLWADGFAIWSWHGVAVRRHVIEAPDTITLAEIDEERNAEVRRVLRERYGEGRYLIDTGAVVIDADVGGSQMDPSPRVLLEGRDKQRVLVGTDGGTGRTYYMPVDATIKTCRKAHESLCGFAESEILFGS